MRAKFLSFLGLLCLPAAAAATEHEVAQFGSILETCFGAAPDIDAQTACIGQMSTTCMDTQEGGHTTLGMSSCLMAETQVWDKHLNAEYRTRMSELKAMDADEAEYFPEYARRAAALRDAQRAWIVFRDAECGLDYAMWGSGSMRNIAGADCQMTMTAERAIALKNLGSEMR